MDHHPERNAAALLLFKILRTEAKLNVVRRAKPD
jgi:hypothetical protein